MSAMDLYAWLTVITGAYMLLFTTANILYLRTVAAPAKLRDGPRVSVLIPARNEASRIGPALEGLAEQDYGSFEVLVLDDNSDDGTWDIVREFAARDDRFRVLGGEPLPEGWKRKPFAMQQLTAAASGDILIFMDADMRPGPELISWTVTNLESHGVDFLSGYARHTSPEAAEYLLFPVMYLATSFLLPLWLFRRTRSYMFSHAIGQFFCVRSRVLEDTRGFEPVRDKINEDIQMARYLKGAGYQQVFLDAKEHLSGNMYDSMDHAKMGIMRVVYEYFDNLVYPFIFMGSVMVALLLLPIPACVAAAIVGHQSARPLLVGILLVLSAWSATMADRKIPWYTALLYPVHFGWAVILSIRSIVLSKRGRGYRWKGRTVR